MNGSHCHTSAIAAKLQFLASALLGLLIVALFTAASPSASVPSKTADEQYIQIMSLIDRADALHASGKTEAARAKYKQAEAALILFKRANPLFSPKAVAYRLAEVTDRIEARPPLPSASAPTNAKSQVNLEAPPKASTTAKSSVKLLDPGAEPRKALRLHVKPGDKQAVIMTIKMSMETPGAATGSNSTMNIPAASLPADVTIQSVAPNGDITYQMVLGEPGVVEEPGASPQIVQGMKTALAGLKGLTVTAVTSDHGIGKKADMKAPVNADPQSRQMMEQIKDGMSEMASPLPEEAVGSGAKWQVTMPVKAQGINLEHKADYQLVSVNGDNISTKCTFTESAANQKIHNAAMGQTQINLISFTNNGTATVASDLSKLIPLQATIDVHSDVSSEMTVGNNTQPMAQKTAMNVTVESK